MSKTISSLESVSIHEAAPHRCAFRNRQGNRCRTMLPDDSAEFCASHARSKEKLAAAEAAKLTAELLEGCDDLQSVQGIHNAFANLYKLFAAKKIARADAFLLAYIIRSIVRTALVLNQGHVSDEKPTVNIIWKNMGRSQSEPVSSPDSTSEPLRGEHSASAASSPTLDTHHFADPVPPRADQPSSPPPPPPPPFPSKPQTEFPLDEHPWGVSAARPVRRRCGPKYRGF